MTDREPPSAVRWCTALAGAALIGSAFALDPLLGKPAVFGKGQIAMLVFGLALLVASALPAVWHMPKLRRRLTGVSLLLLSALGTLAVAEILGRTLEIDFAKEEDTFLAIPPCFRQPVKASGSVYFRRPGPQSWTGPVLNTRCSQLGVRPNPYEDEAPITVTYDANGFRNLPGLDDWDVAVIGDSFTELGYLPDEELFTTLLGEGLGRRVKNLGVSMTGPNAQHHYLMDFGLSPALTDVVQVFYEGNDHHDVWNERRLLRELEATGERSQRSFTRQSSLLRAIASFFEGDPPSPRGTDVTSGWFLSPKGGEVPISIYRVPPGTETMKPDARTGLEEALANYAALCRERGLRSWLVYMPVKTRVLFGMVRFTDLASDKVRAWTPTDYPAFLQEICAREGIRFLDMTPVFRAVTEDEGVLVYNSIWDEHLNARGSALVAESLLQAMGPVLQSADQGAKSR